MPALPAPVVPFPAAAAALPAALARRLALGLALGAALLAGPVAAVERIKDLAQVEGVRGNPLVGYGLVVGLDGTGDRTSQSPFTTQSLKNLLDELGVTVPPNVNPQLKNVAAVAIHAELPPFARPGQTIDVTVSSISNAVSLRGGALLMAPLKGADGQVYAIAQGNLVVGGFGAAGADGSKVSVNVPSSGRIPNGAIVERALPDALAQAGQGGRITLSLRRPDFTTATRMVEALNRAFGEDAATALDAGTVQVQAPLDPGARVAFLARVENLTLEPGEALAKVVVNARTGTVVIGRNVQVLPAAVAHGSLTVTITEAVNVSQPAPFSQGQTVVAPESTVEASADGSRMFLFKGGTSLDQIVRAVNEVGAAPGDLIAILEALKQVGALRAELEII
ncbi:flagellar basal body P-ring protein FlgI [Silanimonas lenta]|uniref:flagellar basal body P-ring protein FlgI n=1 Tax=Silanimonas lenta TaxID=265429 RepID=UPI002FDF167B